MTESETNPRKDATPRGLVLFRPGTSPSRRRRRMVFLALYLLVAALIVWPVFPLFAGVDPQILGLPLSLAWVVLALSIMFGALLWLYRADGREADGDS